eukprot:5057367-Prymnesium_polylepis.1
MSSSPLNVRTSMHCVPRPRLVWQWQASTFESFFGFQYRRPTAHGPAQAVERSVDNAARPALALLEEDDGGARRTMTAS